MNTKLSAWITGVVILICGLPLYAQQPVPARSVRSELQGEPLRLKAWRDFMNRRAALGSRPQAAEPARETQGRFITFTPPGAVDFTVAQGINPRGDIVGGYFDSIGWRTFVLSKHGEFRDVTPQGATGGGLAGGWLNTEMAINSQGDLVSSYDTGGPAIGFLLSKGNYTPIDVPGASDCYGTIPAGINPQGDIVGWYAAPPDCVGHGFLLRDGVYTTIDVPGGFGTSALAINPQGDILGTYDDHGGTHGFLLHNGTFTTIDQPGAVGDTYLFGMNAQGDIVGFSFTFGSFLLSNGTFRSIDFPPGVGGIAWGIDPQGNIVGGYCDDNGCGGFLLKKE